MEHSTETQAILDEIVTLPNGRKKKLGDCTLDEVRALGDAKRAEGERQMREAEAFRVMAKRLEDDLGK